MGYRRINLSFDSRKDSHNRSYEMLKNKGREKTDFIVKTILNDKENEDIELIKAALREVLNESNIVKEKQKENKDSSQSVPDDVFDIFDNM
ncbi:hypothetical protein PRVXT_000230 [Proteinivorax tanatarense]|uniref:Uncharacterized protein n=1 Tax=Proteinivorax tanatarense TaxID=1260629 RepID=A0AAU7VLZ3_9FIRM